MYFENDPEDAYKDSVAVWGKKRPKRVVPSIMIAERDAVLFERLIRSGKRVVLSIDIDSTENKTDTGNFDYYIMINDPLSYSLIAKIFDFRFDSYGLVNFRPIYSFTDLKDHQVVRTPNCFNNNRYCIHAEKNQPFKTDEYRDEAIRQICLWNESKGKFETERHWWEYVMSYSKLCMKKDNHQTLSDCSEAAIRRASVDRGTISKVEQCYKKNSKEFDRIPIIDAQYKKNYDFEQYPGIVVNDTLIRGYVSQKSIISSVCDSYIHRPAVCYRYEIKFNTFSVARQTSFWHVHGLLIFCVLLITVIILAVKYVMSSTVNRDIEQNVRDHVHTYYRMNESDIRLKDTDLRPDETTG